MSVSRKCCRSRATICRTVERGRNAYCLEGKNMYTAAGELRQTTRWKPSELPACDISIRRVTTLCKNEYRNDIRSLTAACHSESLILLPLVERRTHKSWPLKKAHKPLSTPSYTSSTVPQHDAGRCIKEPHPLSPDRCRVTLVHVLGSRRSTALCDGAIDGSSDGAAGQLEACLGACIERLALNDVFVELGFAKDGHAVIGRFADSEERC